MVLELTREANSTMEFKESMKEECMIAKCGIEESKEEEVEMELDPPEMELDPVELESVEVELAVERKSESAKKMKEKDEFMNKVMEAVRLTRVPSPRMVQREKLARMLKRNMERVMSRPGSFVAESLRYNGELARAYLRFGLPTCPPKEELAIRENRMLRRKMMMLSQDD